ncbi:MAG: GNAT family N-acetyltransferase [bacterium]
MEIVQLNNSPDAIRAGVRVLIRAFESDPLWVYVFPGSKKRVKKLAAIFGFLIRFGLKRGRVETVREINGLAVWLSDKYYRVNFWNAILVRGLLLPFEIGLGALRKMIMVEQVNYRLHSKVISRPHQYLALVGVKPEFQKLGLGTRLVKNGIERCRQQGLPVYLETTNPGNIVFYERLGFKLVKTAGIPRAPVKVHAMVFEQ